MIRWPFFTLPSTAHRTSSSHRSRSPPSCPSPALEAAGHFPVNQTSSATSKPVLLLCLRSSVYFPRRGLTVSSFATDLRRAFCGARPRLARLSCFDLNNGCSNKGSGWPWGAVAVACLGGPPPLVCRCFCVVFFVPACRFSLRSCPVRVTLYLGKGLFFLSFCVGGSVVSASSFSPVVALGGCARCAGASVGRLSVSRSGFGRLAFVFPSAAWASRFASVLSGWSWVSLVAGVRCRGSVVVVALWGVFPPAAPPAVPLSPVPVLAPAPARAPWCGVAPAFAPVPSLRLVCVGTWSPVSFALRGLGFVQSPVPGSSSWSLPPSCSRPVWRLASARRAAHLFGFGLLVCRPAHTFFGVWGFNLFVRA